MLISLAHRATYLLFLFVQEQNLLAPGNWTWVLSYPAGVSLEAGSLRKSPTTLSEFTPYRPTLSVFSLKLFKKFISLPPTLVSSDGRFETY